MDKEYRPIRCDLYDELVLLAIRKTKCNFVFKAGDNKVLSMTSIIRDIYTKNKEEFIALETGLLLRLDKLISIDGKRFK